MCYQYSMGWLIEMVMDQVWDEYIYRIYKRFGFVWAGIAIILPLLLIAVPLAIYLT